jgi:hypothetical protein
MPNQEDSKVHGPGKVGLTSDEQPDLVSPSAREVLSDRNAPGDPANRKK